MYNTMPNFVLGFHGCEKEVLDKVIINQERLNKSENRYDWLGHGIYFWGNNPQRAYEFAEESRDRGKIKEIAVICAIIDLGYYLNLVESESLKIVKKGDMSYYKIRLKMLVQTCPKTKM